jgi:hypothetical protein
MRNIIKDKRGIAWVWVTAALAICFAPLIYWAIGWPVDIAISQILGTYTFSGVMGFAYTAVKLVISYMLAFVLFIVVVWSWVNSRSPQYG